MKLELAGFTFGMGIVPLHVVYASYAITDMVEDEMAAVDLVPFDENWSIRGGLIP